MLINTERSDPDFGIISKIQGEIAANTTRIVAAKEESKYKKPPEDRGKDYLAEWNALLKERRALGIIDDEPVTAPERALVPLDQE